MERHQVSSATFWRAVRQAKSDLAAEDMRLVCQGIQTRSVFVGRDPLAGDPVVADDRGVPPRIDFLAAYRQLFADTVALRAYALNPDGTVKRPLILDRAIKTRLTVISRSVKLLRQVYEVRNVQIFMDALVEEIALESPDLQRRILARLRSIQSVTDRGNA
jgi:hypothetical protein